MSNTHRASTKDVLLKGFIPHGSMDLQVSGQLNVIEARGPFNIELVTAGDMAQEQVDAALQAKGRWATMLVFRDNAMASLEVLAEVEAIVKRRVAKGLCPAGVALVLGPEVEGAALMGPYYRKAYTNAGILTQVFATPEDGQAWLQALLTA